MAARRTLAVSWLVIGIVIGLANSALGQRLYEREPFDRITLNEENNNQVLEVLPIPFKPRRVPAKPKPTDKLAVRLVSRIDEEYEIQWRGIAKEELSNGTTRFKVDLFEDMVLAKAEAIHNGVNIESANLNVSRALAAFDEAFDYYYFLHQRYPETLGLQRSYQTYLFRNAALLLLKANRPHRALSALEELHEQNPAGNVIGALNVTVDRILGSYIQKNDVTSAQKLLRRLDGIYKDKETGKSQLTGADKWRNELIRQAAEKRDEVRKLIAANDLREAFEVSQEMLHIWPDVEGGKQLAREIFQRYPRVVVGVHELSTGNLKANRIDSWPARRTGRLLERTLLEFESAGPTGGRYTCPFGAAAQSEDQRRLTIRLKQPTLGSEEVGLTGYELSRLLRRKGDPADALYDPHWAGIMSGVSVEDVYRVQIDLRRQHVLPESLLQFPFSQSSAAGQDAAYIVDRPQDKKKKAVPQATGSMTFLANQDYKFGTGKLPAEIEEKYFDDREQAITALIDGKIDVLDHVLPGDLSLLRGVPSISVKQYAHPTLHVLVPNYTNPFMKRAIFRSSLAFAIPRQAILNQLILKGQKVAGCEVISGPFPLGTGPSDPLSYAYDTSILPRPFDPRRGMTLRLLAENELTEIASNRNEKVPKLGTLTLGHPADPLKRIICEAIVDHFKNVNIPCKLKELPPGETVDSSGECDLVYAEVSIWEPIADAQRLLGDGTIVTETTQHLDQALRRLDASQSWKEVRTNLLDLHRLVNTEVNVIPLWQTVNFFAHRVGVRNVGANPVVLYQNIEQWQIVPPIP